MRIPKKLKLFEQQWRVALADIEPWGVCLPDKRTIVLRESADSAAKAETFLHELLHALHTMQPCALISSAEDEETFVAWLAPILYSAIIRNRLDFNEE